MRAVALMLSVAVAGCFPHNEKARTISKYAEGGMIVAGIGLEFVASSKTGADCDASSMPGTSTSNMNCHNNSTVFGGVGLALILAGLTGFIATISTAEDATKPPPRIDIKAQEPTAKPEVKLPPGTQPAPTTPDPSAPPAPTPTGSAAPSQPAP